ncbi:MAG: RNA methyltransferase [Erysipelotrichaceae bacterium]
MNEEYIFEGNISVKAALFAKRRIVSQIIVDYKKDDRDTDYILKEARKRSIPIIKKEREEIDVIASGKTHGGMIGFGGERNFQQLQDVIKKDKLYLALVEGIEDPYNFGYILRTLYAAGVDGVIIPQRNWTSAAAVVTRSSAGASEYLDLIVASDMEAILSTLHENQIPLICAERKDAVSLYDYSFPSRLCIGIGGEMRGLSKLVKDSATQNIYIPYGRNMKNALNAAAATSVVAFEVYRQLHKSK